MGKTYRKQLGARIWFYFHQRTYPPVQLNAIFETASCLEITCSEKKVQKSFANWPIVALCERGKKRRISSVKECVAAKVHHSNSGVQSNSIVRTVCIKKIIPLQLKGIVRFTFLAERKREEKRIYCRWFSEREERECKIPTVQKVDIGFLYVK